ncbi:Tn3 family transposase [Streptomyces sp. NPDC021354]|uniref:Tn3 family transposase n=1 Tax=Streptomyces sp. NPDC021354 TaxID=3154793 RepID=UPI0033F9DC19
MHLLQSSLVHVNTMLLQQVLTEPARAKKLTEEARRGLTALFWSNINSYGTFRLDMDKRLDLTPMAIPPGRRLTAWHRRRDRRRRRQGIAGGRYGGPSRLNGV